VLEVALSLILALYSLNFFMEFYYLLLVMKEPFQEGEAL